MAIQDTKMHTNLEIIHIMKFDVFVKGSIWTGFVNFKRLVKGLIWVKFTEFGAHHMASMYGNGLFVTLQCTQMHIMPPRKHTHGGFKCLV